MEWNLAAFSEEVMEKKLEAERALARLEAERAETKAKIAQLQLKLVGLERRLGLRPERDPKERWMWAYRKARRLAAFGLAPSANTVAGAHNGSLEEQLSAIQEQYNHYDHYGHYGMLKLQALRLFNTDVRAGTACQHL